MLIGVATPVFAVGPYAQLKALHGYTQLSFKRAGPYI